MVIEHPLSEIMITIIVYLIVVSALVAAYENEPWNTWPLFGLAISTLLCGIVVGAQMGVRW